MLFKFHFFLIVAGFCASNVLLAVYLNTYTDATPIEIGYLFMITPIINVISKPAISLAADRTGSHKKYMVRLLTIAALCHIPLVAIPFLGPEIYVTYARQCWYTVVIFKSLAGVAISGSFSIGDALTMNYARRLGVEFMNYRVWATVSWMVMGPIIGQINEVSFLPKYTPAFMILVSTFLMDALLLWIWPDEYFRMIPADQMRREREEAGPQTGDHLKCLMTRHEILAGMRVKLSVLFKKRGDHESNSIQNPQQEAEVVAKDVATTDDQHISRKTQFRILMLLFKRDPRVIFYLLFLVVVGIIFSPMCFLFAGLADRCSDESCNFSQLAGLLQLSMAASETIIFMFTKNLKKVFGRVAFCGMAALFAAIEFSIYVIYWETMHPYFALLTSSARGIYFSFGLVVMTDVAFVFANEVRFLIPELKSEGIAIVDLSESYEEKLKVSLAATMQATTSAAIDGAGGGLGALAAGILIERYSYHALWVALSTLSIGSTIGCLLVWTFDKIFKPKLGLDVKAGLNEQRHRDVVL